FPKRRSFLTNAVSIEVYERKLYSANDCFTILDPDFFQAAHMAVAITRATQSCQYRIATTQDSIASAVPGKNRTTRPMSSTAIGGKRGASRCNEASVAISSLAVSA